MSLIDSGLGTSSVSYHSQAKPVAALHPPRASGYGHHWILFPSQPRYRKRWQGMDIGYCDRPDDRPLFCRLSMTDYFANLKMRAFDALNALRSCGQAKETHRIFRLVFLSWTTKCFVKHSHADTLALKRGLSLPPILTVTYQQCLFFGG